jgi:hypothetical protein
MTETIVHVFGDHTRHCNTHKYILREVPVGLYIVSYRNNTFAKICDLVGLLS